MDPDIYPNPEVFDPENFSKEAKKNRSPWVEKTYFFAVYKKWIKSFFYSYAFLSFGQGPRACLAMRFALLEAKVGLIMVFRHFKLLPSQKTVEKVELDPKAGLGGNKGGLWAKAEPRVF